MRLVTERATNPGKCRVRACRITIRLAAALVESRRDVAERNAGFPDGPQAIPAGRTEAIRMDGIGGQATRSGGADPSRRGEETARPHAAITPGPADLRENLAGLRIAHCLPLTIVETRPAGVAGIDRRHRIAQTSAPADVGRRAADTDRSLGAHLSATHPILQGTRLSFGNIAGLQALADRAQDAAIGGIGAVIVDGKAGAGQLLGGIEMDFGAQATRRERLAAV